MLTVLTMVRSCPADLAAALDRALRRRSLFNARLAEHVNRLKRSAPQPPPAAAAGAAAAHLHGVVGPEAPAPTPSTTGGMAAGGPATGGAYSPTTTAPSSPAPMLLPPPMLAARQASAVAPGGSMAPAPSLATAADGAMDAAVRAAAAAGGPPSGAGSRIAGLQFPAGRVGSFANPGPSPLGRMVPAPRGAATDAVAVSGTDAGPVAAAGTFEDGGDGANSSLMGITAPPSLSADSMPQAHSLQNAGSFALTGFGSGASVSMWAAPPAAGAHPPATIIEEVPSTAAEVVVGAHEGEPTAGDPAAARAVHAAQQPQPHPPAGSTAQPHFQSAFHHHPHAHAAAAGGMLRPAYLLPPSTPSTPYTPAPPSLASEAQRHPVQLAVIVAHAEIRALSLKYLEYYADPSGAMPSGLSSNDTTTAVVAAAGSAAGAVAAGAGVARAAAEADAAVVERSSAGSTASGAAGPLTGKPPRAQHGPGQARAPGGAVAVSVVATSSSSPAGAPPVSAPAAAAAAARRNVPGSGIGTASRATAVSRQTEHSTLLQCLVCELVRSSHSVAATVSWRATLEGGRGLAGCFVHPILHGGSSAAGASVAAALALGPGGGGGTASGSAGGPIVLGRPTASSASGEDSANGRGGGDSMSGAEAAQRLLLSLMDVAQWAAAPSNAMEFGMGMGLAFSGGAYGRRTMPPMAAAAAGGAAAASGAGAGAGGGGVGAMLGRKAPTDTGMVVVRAGVDPPRSARATSVTPANTAAAADAAEPQVNARRAASAERPLAPARRGSGTGSGAGSGTAPRARADQLTDGGASASAGAGSGSVSMSGDRLARPSATPPGSPGVSGTGRLSFSALTDAPDLDPDTDVSGYPLAASSSTVLGLAAAGLGHADAKAAADRHGNSSMKQHNNPAFGLHSPTPSNLSEFWEENSEAPSPASLRHTTGGGDGATSNLGAEGVGGHSGGGGGGGPRMLLWRGNSGLALSDAQGASAHDGTCAHPPEPGSVAVTTSGSGPGPHLGAAADSHNVSGGNGTGGGPTSRRLSMEAAEGAGGRSVEGTAPAAASAHPLVEGDGASDSVAASATSGTGDAEQQLPTLSYLALPGSLADIRKAVEAARQAAASDGAAGQGAKPVALADAMAAAAAAANGRGAGGRGAGGMFAGSPPLPFGEAGGSPGPGGGPSSAASLAMSDLSMLGVMRGGTASGATPAPRHGDDVLGPEGLVGAGGVGAGGGGGGDGSVVGSSARNHRGSDGGNSLSGLGGPGGSMDGTQASASAFLCSVLTSPDVAMGRGSAGAAGPPLLMRHESGMSGASELSLLPARGGSSVSSGLATPMLPNGDAAAAAGRGGGSGAGGPLPPRPRTALTQSQSLPRTGSTPRDHPTLEQRQSLPRHDAAASAAAAAVAATAATAQRALAGSPRAAPAASPAAATPTATPSQPQGQAAGVGTGYPHQHPHHGGTRLHHAVLALAHAQAREAATPSPTAAAGLSTGGAAGIGLSDFLRVPSTGSPADSFSTGTPGGGGLASEFLVTPRSGATTARSGAGSSAAMAGPTRSLLDQLTTAAAAESSPVSSPAHGSASAALGPHGSPMPVRLPAAAGAAGAAGVHVPPITPAKEAWAPAITPAGPRAEGAAAAAAAGLGVAAQATAATTAAAAAAAEGTSAERWAEAVGVAPQPQHPASGALADGGAEAAPASTPSPRRVVSATSLRVSPVPPSSTPPRVPATSGTGHTPPSATRIPHMPGPGSLAAVGSPPLPPSGRRRISGPGGSPGASAYQSPPTGGLIRASRAGVPPHPTHAHVPPAGASTGVSASPVAAVLAAGGLGVSASSRMRRSHEGEKGKGSLHGSRDLSGGGHNPLYNPPAAPGSPGPGGAGRGVAAATKSTSFNRVSATGSNKPTWH